MMNIPLKPPAFGKPVSAAFRVSFQVGARAMSSPELANLGLFTHEILGEKNIKHMGFNINYGI
jgi:hypothetical protein